MATIDDLFDFLNQKFAAVDERFSSMDERFSSMDERFSSMEQRFSDFEADVRLKFDELRLHIDLSVESLRSDSRAYVEGLTAQRDRLDQHDRDIAVLQGSHQDLNGRVTRLENKP